MTNPSESTLANTRWIPVLAGMMLQVCGGTIYVTSLYTTDLKERFFAGPSGQASVEQLVFACNLGNWIPLAGFFHDSRIGGARNTALVASLLTLAGYLGMWAWSAEVIAPQYWQVIFLWFLWGHGSGWFDNAAVSTMTKNFPLQRGRAMALIKAFYGLSGSILTVTYNLFFFGETSRFFLFLAVFLPIAGVLSAPLMYLVPERKHREHDSPMQRLNLGLSVVLGLAVFLLGASFARAFLSGGRWMRITAFSGMLVFLGVLPLMARGSLSPARTGSEVLAPGAAAPISGRDGVSVGRALTTPDFWLLFYVVFVGMGGGLVVLNNVGQMVVALGGDEKLVTVLVSMCSIANCFGRVSLGVLSDAFGDRAPRTAFLAGNLVLMLSAQALLAAGTLPLLFIGAVMAIFSYGGYWTLVPSIVADLFDTVFFATIYNCMSLAVSSASLVFSTLLAARLYDAAGQGHPGASGEGCSGATCFRLTHMVMAAAAGTGVLSAWMLHRRMQRARSQAEAGASLCRPSTFVSR